MAKIIICAKEVTSTPDSNILLPADSPIDILPAQNTTYMSTRPVNHVHAAPQRNQYSARGISSGITFFLVSPSKVATKEPLIKLLKDKRIKSNFSDKIKILAYKESYHMILRDLNGDQITEDLKNWVIGKEYDSINSSFIDILKQIENTEFYHRLDL